MGCYCLGSLVLFFFFALDVAKLLFMIVDHLDTIYHQAVNLQAHVDHATATGNWQKACRFQELIATEKGRYSFSAPTLNALVGVEPIPFWNWLQREWGA
jgi:hypothetical protein